MKTMPQISQTLPKEKWQNVVIVECNDPIVYIKPTLKIHLANPDIQIRKTLVGMLEKASQTLPDNMCLYVVEGVRSIEKQEKQWSECYEKTKVEFPDKDIEFWERQTGSKVP